MNGVVIFTTTTFRSIATYECNKGYLLDTSNDGFPYVQCLANGDWSAGAPSCVRKS